MGWAGLGCGWGFWGLSTWWLISSRCSIPFHVVGVRGHVTDGGIGLDWSEFFCFQSFARNLSGSCTTTTNQKELLGLGPSTMVQSASHRYG